MFCFVLFFCGFFCFVLFCFYIQVRSPGRALVNVFFSFLFFFFFFSRFVFTCCNLFNLYPQISNLFPQILICSQRLSICSYRFIDLLPCRHKKMAASFDISGLILWYHHRYTPEIPKPAPSLSRQSALGSNCGYSGFPAIKITVIRQVRMYCGLSVKISTRKTLHSAQRW